MKESEEWYICRLMGDHTWIHPKEAGLYFTLTDGSLGMLWRTCSICDESHYIKPSFAGTFGLREEEPDNDDYLDVLALLHRASEQSENNDEEYD